MFKYYISILFFLVITNLTYGQTVYGALAIDRSNGYYYGWAYDYASLNGAENRALKECVEKGGNCIVVLTWEGKGCGAYRTVSGVGTAYGWGVAATQSEANAIATREVFKRSKGATVTDYVWACNSVGSFKEITNSTAAPSDETSTKNPTRAEAKTTTVKRNFFDSDGDEYAYEGELLNDLPHGKGIQVYLKSGNVYTGQFKNGMREGKGKITWKSGSTYEGGWLKDKFEGRGVYRWADGKVYDGEFANGKMVRN